MSSNGRYAATVVVSADNEHRYIVALAPRRQGPHRRAPARRGVGARARRIGAAADLDGLPARRLAALVHLRAQRLDAPLSSSTRDAAARRRGSSRAARGRSPTSQLTPDRRTFLITSTEADAGRAPPLRGGVDGGARTRLTTTRARTRASCRPTARRRADLVVGNRPPEVFLAKAPAAGAALADARPAVTTSPTSEWLAGLDRSAGRHLPVARRRDGPRTPLHAGDGRREAHGIAAGGGVRARRRLPAERAPVLVVLLPRVHVPPPARGRAATWCSTSTTAPAPATGATGAPAIYRHMGGNDLDDIVDGAT